ncbi:hypothetical protein Isop_0929 [Isosphaera pallida ATCC 43644]|uniref:HEAT repeat domain-containing protein n=1 Tax=Isosphaera pallida (strain ATCC 43644 / DSM 9630 / IS1B) TaxID=575540 RepID=E8R314_ISOPI|nr:HEAT repeat domain-containing protein [Isosphaera pallida]ADV61518.1 hypothetical protein Isop_0929 [Isosphaera pallida ATCC 43644]
MSIAILNQVYDETKRLAVAGAMVAHGDFRLKKLIAPLELAGTQAPVLAKVADAARRVVEGEESQTAEALLDLAALVTAILFTQGTTGVEGQLEPIESIHLEQHGSIGIQASARTLKPLLDALTGTGSGRVAQIQEAHERGLFRDPRLVTPALKALDDPYAEIAEIMEKKVLPLYGKAIVPLLRADYDPQGKTVNARRLRLIHRLDPETARPLVLDALEHGSKEVKLAALACLGDGPDDLARLVEQARARNQEVRAAAFAGLVKHTDPVVPSLIQTALQSKDYQTVADIIQESKREDLVVFLIRQIQTDLDGLAQLDDKKEISARVERITHGLQALNDTGSTAAEQFLLNLFPKRDQWIKLKGTPYSGNDLCDAIIQAMATFSTATQTALAQAHAEFEADKLARCFKAGITSLSPARLFDLFSPYLTATTPEETKHPARKAKVNAKSNSAKALVILETLGGHRSGSWWDRHDEESLDDQFDPRWLDLALTHQHLGAVVRVGKIGHPGLDAFLATTFQETISTAKDPNALYLIVHALVTFRHPLATDAILATSEKMVTGKYQYYHIWWLPSLVAQLPKASLSRLEEMVPKLKGYTQQQWVEAIKELRARPWDPELDTPAQT